MSFVIATPEMMQEAAQDLAGIRSSLAEATVNSADTTTGVTAAAQDEVSIALTSMLGSFGQKFHTLSAQAQAFHQEFVKLVDAGAGAYISTEVANAFGFASLEIPIFGPGSIDLSGSAFGGFLPGLLTFLPEQLAEVIGAPIPVAPVSM